MSPHIQTLIRDARRSYNELGYIDFKVRVKLRTAGINREALERIFLNTDSKRKAN